MPKTDTVDRLVALIEQAARDGRPCPTNAQIAAALSVYPVNASALLRKAEIGGLVVVERGTRDRVVAAADGSWRTAGQIADPVDMASFGRACTGPWTAEKVEELVRLWGAGLTTGEIAKRLGVGKNAVVGKAHRLDLPRRESPLERGIPHAMRHGKVTGSIEPIGRRASKRKQSPAGRLSSGLGHVAPSDPAGGSGQSPATGGGLHTALPPRVAPSAPAPASGQFLAGMQPRSIGRVRAPDSAFKTCQWIEGEAAGAETRFCGAPNGRRADGGRSSYCAEHHARCFVLARPREARAA